MQRKFNTGDNVYFTSDPHLTHKNVIKFCNRPFETIEEMDNELIANWNNVVGKKDNIFILGDFCFANKYTIEKFLKELNGRKYMICGNHDNPKALRQLEGYFEFIGDMLDITYNKMHFVLCHYPLHSWNRSHYGSINLHGHNHDYQLMRKNQYNVGVDLNAYSPIHVDNLLINLEKQNENIDINHSS